MGLPDAVDLMPDGRLGHTDTWQSSSPGTRLHFESLSACGDSNACEDVAIIIRK